MQIIGKTVVKTRVFAYKGYVGAETDLENGVFRNDPMKIGQCGCIVSVDELEITQEAIYPVASRWGVAIESVG